MFKHNKIRAELAKRGIRVLRNPFTKRGIIWLKKYGIEAIDECLAMIGSLNGGIKEISEELKLEAEEIEDAKLLMTISGVDTSLPSPSSPT